MNARLSTASVLLLLLLAASAEAGPALEEWLVDAPRAFVQESRPWSDLPVVEQELGWRWGKADGLNLRFGAEWLSAGAYRKQIWRARIEGPWSSLRLGLGLEEWSEKIDGHAPRIRRRPEGMVQWRDPTWRLGIAVADPVGAGLEARLAGRIQGEFWRFTLERQPGRWGGDPAWGGRLEFLHAHGRLLLVHLGDRAAVGAEIRRGSLGLSFEEEIQGPRFGGRTIRLGWWAP